MYTLYNNYFLIVSELFPLCDLLDLSIAKLNSAKFTISNPIEKITSAKISALKVLTNSLAILTSKYKLWSKYTSKLGSALFTSG